MNQWQIWPGRAKLTRQRFAERAWRARLFADGAVWSVRVAAGRQRFVLVVARRGAPTSSRREP